MTPSRLCASANAGREPDSCAKLLGRRVQFTRLTERKPEREMRLGQRRLQFDRLPQFAQRRRRISFRKPGEPLRIVCLRKFRFGERRQPRVVERLRPQQPREAEGAAST